MNILRLRPYKESDAQEIVKWNKDEFAFYQWSADRYDHYPISAADINKQYEAMAEADGFYPMTAFDETGIVGHLTMRFTDEKKQILRFGFIIVDDTRRGKGFGKGMLLLALKYAFEILQVKTVILGVFENNSAAYYCYKAAGFHDVTTAEPEFYHVLDEDWKCLELETVQSPSTNVRGIYLQKNAKWEE